MGLGPCGFCLSAGQEVTRVEFARLQDFPRRSHLSVSMITRLVLVFPLVINSAWAEAHPTGNPASRGVADDVYSDTDPSSGAFLTQRKP